MKDNIEINDILRNIHERLLVNVYILFALLSNSSWYPHRRGWCPHQLLYAQVVSLISLNAKLSVCPFSNKTSK